MAIDTINSFVDEVRQTRLLEPEQLDEVVRVQGKAVDPRALAKALIQKGWMTPYQVNTIFQGQANSLVLGQYRILERLGEGGMGQVFKARHAAMGRVVALKVIRKEKLNNAEAVKRFHREIRAASALHHPNIVLAFDADHSGDTHYLAMEFVDGTDLGKLTKEKGPLPVDRACEYVRQAATGLQYAHERGMVHRDIKPANLLLLLPKGRANGKAGPDSSARLTKPLVKILDMGLARLQQQEEQGESLTALSMDGTVMGTPDFMAPEQAKNSHKVDHRADIYSLGCTLYYLLTRQPPFPGGSNLEKLLKHQMDAPRPLREFRPDVPAGVQQVLDRMLAKKPEDRYQNCADVTAALGPFCEAGAGNGVQASLPPTVAMPAPAGALTATSPDHALATPASMQSLPDGTPRPHRRPLMGRKKPLLFAAAGLVLLGGFVVLLAALSSSAPKNTAVASGTGKEPAKAPPETPPATARDTGPGPWKGPGPPIQRLIPDDSTVVAVVNLADVLRSDVAAKAIKHMQVPLEQARQGLQAELGVDLYSIHRAFVAGPGGSKEPDFFLLQGQFEPETIRATLKKHSPTVHKAEGFDYYEVVDSGNGLLKYYAAPVGPRSLVLTKDQEALLNVLEKMSSPRKGNFKDKELYRLLDKIDPRMAAQVMVGGSATIDKNGLTLQDPIGPGIKSINAGVQLGKGVELRLMIACINEEKAKGIQGLFNFIILPALRKQSEPLADALGGVTFVTARDDKSVLYVEKRFSVSDVMNMLPKPPR